MLLLILFAFLSHPIHISVCEIDYSDASKTLQFSQRIFADDLEKALNKLDGKQIDILKLTANSRNNYLKKYMKDKIEMKINDQLVELNYLGSEIEEGVCWIYYESDTLKSYPNNFLFKDIPLFEMYDDQSTIIQVVKTNKDVINFRLFGDKIEENVSLN